MDELIEIIEKVQCSIPTDVQKLEERDVKTFYSYQIKVLYRQANNSLDIIHLMQS